jgi:integrase/recombinase XerD
MVFMRKKIGLTIVELAVQEVAGFDLVVAKFDQRVVLKGQSVSTFNNYIRKIAALCLHFGKLPEALNEDEINVYLVGLARSSLSPSRSGFKHLVYGLRYYFRLFGLNKRALSLPSIKHESKLPVILNRTELKELFKAPTLLKHSILLALIYSAGLRGQEAVNLKLSDIDFERRTIHVRQSKYKKDRIMPLSDVMARGLRKYIDAEKPHIYLFNGKEPDGRYSVRGISWVMRETLKKTSIIKDVNLHSLRHAYATHLLEDGLNIVTLKDLLGHADITTTMIYLHVAQCEHLKAHSPLDSLYAKKTK